MLARLGRLDRTHVDQDGARPHRLGDALAGQQVGNDGTVLQHRDDDVGIGHGGGSRIGDGGAVGGQRLRLGAGPVPDGDAVAGAQQAADLTRAHQAQTEKCDARQRFGHDRLQIWQVSSAGWTASVRNRRTRGKYRLPAAAIAAGASRSS